jgi:mannose-6-phosphate isomerase
LWLDYNHYNDIKTAYNRLGEEEELASCEYFITNRIFKEQSVTRNYENLDSFVILMILSGSGKVITEDGSYTFNQGNTYLIPASIKEVRIEANSLYKILEIYIP